MTTLTGRYRGLQSSKSACLAEKRSSLRVKIVFVFDLSSFAIGCACDEDLPDRRYLEGTFNVSPLVGFGRPSLSSHASKPAGWWC